MSYAIRHNVPVYVYVDNEGKITRVVVDDESLSEPVAYVRPHDGEEVPWDKLVGGQGRAFAHPENDGQDWPAWEFGW